MRQTPCWDAPSARGVSASKPGEILTNNGEPKILNHFQSIDVFSEFPKKLLLLLLLLLLFSHHWKEDQLRYQTYILSFILFFFGHIVMSSFLWEDQIVVNMSSGVLNCHWSLPHPSPISLDVKNMWTSWEKHHISTTTSIKKRQGRTGQVQVVLLFLWFVVCPPSGNSSGLPFQPCRLTTL